MKMFDEVLVEQLLILLAKKILKISIFSNSWPRNFFFK
jgi:hypothetical protein